MLDRFYVILPILQRVQRRLCSTVPILIPSCTIAVLSTCSLLTQSGSLSPEETKGSYTWKFCLARIAQNSMWECCFCAAVTTVHVQLGSAPHGPELSKGIPPLAQVVSFPVTASYFLMKDLQPMSDLSPPANPLQLFWEGSQDSCMEVMSVKVFVNKCGV